MNKSRIAKVKGKLYDIHTNNKSFLKVAKDLQTVGINNALFMLEIKDPSVLSIDPYQCDKDGHTTLSRDQISRVMTECARNPWYFLREIVRIPDQGGTAVPYRANRGNIAQAFCIWKGYDSWLCLPRQQGKTISAIAFLAWAYIFGTTNSTFIFLNKDGIRVENQNRKLLENYFWKEIGKITVLENKNNKNIQIEKKTGEVVFSKNMKYIEKPELSIKIIKTYFLNFDFRFVDQ